jgi:hypothetical protein
MVRPPPSPPPSPSRGEGVIGLFSKQSFRFLLKKEREVKIERGEKWKRKGTMYNIKT